MNPIIPLSISDRLKTQHLALATITFHLSAEQLIYKPVQEKWGIRENMAHLAKYQILFSERIDKILTSDTPNFEPYRAENDKQFEKWVQKSPETLLGEINFDRKFLNEKFESLTETDLQKAGIHSTFGKLNVSVWTEFFLLHEAHHLFTIFRLAHTVSISG
jgi:hypothetical protein